MATAIITITDKEEGNVTLSIEFNPAIEKDNDGTYAQLLALMLVQFAPLLAGKDPSNVRPFDEEDL